ncbi:SDR family NAD(P)-dependent oxidoreductase [Oceanibacterium hippocampi]|uniref:2,5-dichloro-2,5-cyclohexadiene-1,4-diol dehydrogenase n=1 Tax=Oceanibacterium hippocampi TaxID=745714 RepID=A0A1Y5RX58_9PROT|nr:SDR family oxidoreductase [Oceanibacterium hippocampi]SLN27028.1 2,5-dichloro-2,5-cyclohexadiene-1,4-diol dehydrogenase [Oceanibacterium hippocampi]
MRLAAKVAVITGGSNGIGAAAAVLFAREGAKVVVADIDADAGRARVAEIAAAGGEAVFAACDVGVTDDIKSALQQAVDTFGGLDILFNNAAIQNTRSILETSDEDFDLSIRVNLKSVFVGIREAARLMIAQGRGGAIVNTSSSFAIVGSPGYAAYHATKGAISSLTRAAAIGLMEHGIRVNAICPGTIDTPGLRRGVATTADDPAEALDRYLALQPMKRFGTAEEIAQAALFLASPEASFVTGENLVADGGYTIV